MAQTNDAGGNELNKVHFKSRSLVEVWLLVDIAGSGWKSDPLVVHVLFVSQQCPQRLAHLCHFNSLKGKMFSCNYSL